MNIDRNYICENVFTITLGTDRVRDNELTQLESLKVDGTDYISLFAVYFPEETGDSRHIRLIDKGLLETVGMSKDELEFFAAVNVKKNLVMQPANDAIHELDPFAGDEFNEDLFTVVTNKKKCFGAGILAFGSVGFSYISDQLKLKKFFVVPSSIHKVSVLPYVDRIPPEYILGLVKKINANYVRPEDRLTDNVYIYDRETDQFSACF